MPQIHLKFTVLVICIVIPRILAKPVEDLKKEPEDKRTYNDETRTGEPQILSANLLENQTEVVIADPSENENQTKQLVARTIDMNSVPAEQITDFNTEVPCDNAQLLLKILTVMLPLLRNEVPPSTRTSYILLILKDLLKSSPEAAENDQILHKINDLILTLDKYHNNDVGPGHPGLRNLGNSAFLPSGIKSEIVFKYEMPRLPNSNCNTELFNIIDNVQKAILRLVNNPICQTKTPLQLPFFIKFEPENNKPDQYTQLPNQNNNFENKDDYLYPPYHDKATDNLPVLPDNIRDENFLYPKDPKQKVAPIFVNDFPGLIYPKLQTDNPVKITPSPAYGDILFPQIYPVNTNPNIFDDDLYERPKSPFNGVGLPSEDDKPTYIWTNTEPTPYKSVSSYPVLLPKGQNINPNSEENLYPFGPMPYDSLPYILPGQTFNYPDSSRPNDDDDIFLPYSAIGQSPNSFIIYPESIGSRPIDDFNLPYSPLSPNPDLFNIYPESFHSTKPNDDLLPNLPLDQNIDSFIIYPELNGSRPIDDFNLPYQRPLNPNSDSFNIYPESFYNTKPNDDLYTYRPVSPDWYNNVDSGSVDSIKPSHGLDIPFPPYNPYEKQKHNPVLFYDDDPETNPTEPSFGQWTGSLPPNNLDVYGEPNSANIPFNTQSTTPISFVQFPDIENDILFKPTESIQEKNPIPINIENILYNSFPGSEIYSPNYPQRDEIPFEFINRLPLSAEINIDQFTPSPKLNIVGSPESAYIPFGAQGQEPDVYIINPTKKPYEPNKYDSLPSSRPLIKGTYLPNGPSNFRPNKPSIQTPNNPFLQPFDYESPDKPLIPFDGSWTDVIGLNPTTETPSESIYLPLQPQLPSYPNKDYLPHSLSPNSNPGLQRPYENVDYNDKFDLYPFLPKDTQVISPDSVTKPPWLPYIDDQYPINFDNNIPQEETFDPDFLPEINTPVIVNDINPTQDYYQSITPDNNILLIIKENIKKMEQNIPKEYLTPALLDMIRKLKELLDLEQITVEKYVIIINRYQILIDHVKKLNLDDELLRDLLFSMTNVGKLDLQGGKSKVIELTYLVKRPKPLIYQPYYYVKYRLPYNSFMSRIDRLLAANPNLKDQPTELYKALISVSKVTETSPDLKGFGKEDILKLTFNKGTLVGAKIIKSKDVGLYKMLDQIKDINTDLSIDDVYRLINNLDVHLKQTSNSLPLEENDLPFYNPDEKNKEIVIKVQKPILQKVTKITTNKLAADQIIRDILNNNQILRSSDHDTISKKYPKSDNYSSLIGKTINRYDLNPLKYLEYAMTKDNRPNQNYYDKIPNIKGLHNKYSEVLNDLHYYPKSSIAYKPKLTSTGSSDWIVYSNPTQYETYPNSGKETDWVHEYNKNAAIPYSQKLTSEITGDWKLYSNPRQYETYPNSVKETDWVHEYKKKSAIPYNQKLTPEVTGDWKLYSNPTQYETYPDSVKETKWAHEYEKNFDISKNQKLTPEVTSDWKLYSNPTQTEKYADSVKISELVDLNGYMQNNANSYKPNLISEDSNDWKLYPNPPEYKTYSSSIKEAKLVDLNEKKPLATTITSKVTTYEQPNKGYPIVEPGISETNLNVVSNTQLHPVVDAKLLEATLKTNKNYKSPELTSTNIVSNTQLHPMTDAKLLEATLKAYKTPELTLQNHQFVSPLKPDTESEITGNLKSIESHIVEESKTNDNGIPVVQTKSYLIEKSDDSEKQYETSKLNAAANLQYLTQGKSYNKNNYNSLNNAGLNEVVNSESQFKSYVNTNNVGQNFNLDTNSYIGNNIYNENGINSAPVTGNQEYSLNSGVQPYLAGNAYNYNLANFGWNVPYNLNLANQLLTPRYRYIQNWPRAHRLIRSSRFWPHRLLG